MLLDRTPRDVSKAPPQTIQGAPKRPRRRSKALSGAIYVLNENPYGRNEKQHKSPKKGKGRQKTQGPPPSSPDKKPQRPCFELVIFVQCVLVSCRSNTTHTHMHLVAHLTTSPSSQGHRHYEDARCISNLNESNTAAPSMVHMLVPAWVAGGALSSRSCNACHG